MGTISLVIPQIGQPDTTEDVKLQNALTTIQTVINGNIDTTNLSASAAIARSQLAGFGGLAWTSISTNTSVTDGHFYGVTATATITLPSPTANATVGVFSAAVGTITISVSSGVIGGVGLGTSGVSSITLGTVGSAVVLVADGTNWHIVAGQQDTGWVALSQPGSWGTTSGFYAPAARLIGDRVWMRGSSGNSTGGTASFTTTLASQFRPASTVAIACQSSIMNVNAVWVNIPTSGALQTLPATPNLQTIGFDGVSYSIV